MQLEQMFSFQSIYPAESLLLNSFVMLGVFFEHFLCFFEMRGEWNHLYEFILIIIWFKIDDKLSKIFWA